MPYHINLMTGVPGKCKASQGRCPFGSADEHHATADEAQQAFEASMADQQFVPLSKGESSSSPSFIESKPAKALPKDSTGSSRPARAKLADSSYLNTSDTSSPFDF